MLSIFSCFFFVLFTLWLFRFSAHFLSGLFFFLILICRSCLFWRLIPCGLIYLQYFSHSVGCLFVLFMVSFAVQKLLSLIRPHLFIFVFIFITPGGGSEKILLWFMSESILPMFSSKFYNVRSYI